MERRAKVELFEQIRREYEFGVGTVLGVARKLGVHRRIVRQALANAQPPERKVAEVTIRQYVRERKQELGWSARATCVPQSYEPGQEGQVDWYESWAEL